MIEWSKNFDDYRVNEIKNFSTTMQIQTEKFERILA